MDAYKRIEEIGVVPVIKIPRPDMAEKLAKALLEGGISTIEVLFRVESAVESLKRIKKTYPDMLVGAGTVMTVKQIDDAMAAGADFIVSPGYDQRLVDYCNEKGMPIIPGCSNASEIQAAYVSGLRIVKFFPADVLGGETAVKAYAGPFIGMRFMLTGGITLDNLGNLLKNEKIVACGGSFVAPAAELAAEDYDAITARCRKAIRAGLNFELAHVGINLGSAEEAEKTATLIARLFDMPVDKRTKCTFAGKAVECMNYKGYGEKGHIGFRTSSMPRAMAWLRGMGVELNEESFQYDANGNVTCAYLKDEIAGFAIHIVK